MKIPILLALGLCSFNVVAQQTLILQPDAMAGKDAHVTEYSPSTNYGGDIEFITYQWTFGGVQAGGKSYLQFDLSQLPAAASITNAKLSLYFDSLLTSAGQAGNNSSKLYRVTSAWQENTITWNQQPTHTTSQAVSLATSLTNNQSYDSIDITPFVQFWQSNPNQNFGMMLALDTFELYRSMKFCSSDFTTASKRPKLTISYSIRTGINDKLDHDYFTLSPNPSDDKLEINIPQLAHGKMLSLTVIDAKGTLVSSSYLQKGKNIIDCSQWQSGIYFVRVGNDEQTLVKEFVKQ